MRILVDTNVLVRSVERTSPFLRTAREALKLLAHQGDELCVTPQNIAEFWNVCTRPISTNGLENSIAVSDRLTSRIEMLFTVLPDTLDAFRQWRRLIVTHAVKGAKVHDARLVAAMQAHGIARILTFNVGDFKRYDNIIVLDPASLVP